MSLKFFLLSVVFFAVTCTAFCQTDTEFWFVAPEVSQNGDQNFDRPIYLRMSSFDHPSVVTVSQPANPAFKPITVTIAANSSQTVDLTPFIDEIENKPPDQVLNYGIYVKSTKPIQAYYEVASLETNYNPEIFSFKGKNALGTHFIIPGQTVFHNDGNYNPKPYFAFDIVATSDSTTVIINPTKDIIGHSAEIPFTEKLNKGQTYSAAGIGYDPSFHSIGSEVISNKPIAITIKDDLLNDFNGCADLIGDQIVPVNFVGNEYNAVKGFLDEGEYIFITCTEDSTKINVWNPNLSSSTLNKSSTWGFPLKSNSCHIESDKPVYAYQISGIGCELGSALLPQIKCTGSRQVAFTRTTAQQLSIMIFTTNDAVDGFAINGNTNLITPSSFSPIPGTNNQWQFTRFTFSTAAVPINQTIIVSNSKNFFHLGVLEGAIRTGCSYGFFSDFNSLNLGDDFSICPGDSAELDAGYGKDPYRWSTGSTNRSIVVRDSGTYWVIARLGNCEVSDTIHVSLATMNVLSLGQDRQICKGDTIILSAGGGFSTYKWNTGDTTEQISVISAGTYSVETVSPEGCIQRDSVNISLIDSTISISYTGNPCTGDTVRLITDPGFQYYWWVNLPKGGAVLNFINFLDVTKSGHYYVRAESNSGCVAQSDTIDIEFNNRNLELASNPPLNNGQLDFGRVRRLGINCLSVDLTNNGTEPYTLKSAYLKHNTVFSVPQSQFDINLGPGESKELVICFSPEIFGVLTDSLFISDTCNSLTIGLFGEGVGDTYSGISNCNIPVVLTSGDSTQQYFEIALPSPNPAEDNVRCQFIFICPDRRMTLIKGNLYDMLGYNVATAVKNILENNRKENQNIIKGEFIFDTKKLPSGIYMIVASGDRFRAVEHLMILK
jgi:hypothetical protein